MPGPTKKKTRVPRAGAPGEPFSRLATAGLRLHKQGSAAALHDVLTELAAELVGARRVLVVADGPAGLQVAASKLPRGEDAATLLLAITPWLDEARRKRIARLRHGPEGAKPIDQRSCLTAPLTVQGQLLGLLYTDVDGAYGRFGAAERDLLAALAAQAAVALANLRTTEGLEQQVAERTAAAEQRAGELALINSIQEGMAAELEFQAIVELVGEKLRGLFGSGNLGIGWFDDAAGVLKLAYGVEHGQRLPLHTFELSAVAVGRRWYETFKSRRAVLWNNQGDYGAWELLVAPGTDMSRSGLATPIFAKDRLLGFISLENHEREHAFGDADVRLLSTVASSMGVALENARLFDETQVALAQQAASTEVLRSISESVSDTRPVFTTILNCCNRLIHDLDYVQVQLVDEHCMVQLADHRFGLVRGAEVVGQDKRRAELMAREASVYPRPLAGTSLERALHEGSAVVFVDAFTDPDVPPATRVDAQRWGHSYSQVTVPLMREGRGVGAIVVARRRTDGFLPGECALLKNFADQAVIAIQNSRLFHQTQRALERQTATAQILDVIANSPEDVQPVLDAIVESAKRLIGGFSATVFRVFDGMVHLAAFTRTDEAGAAALQARFPAPLSDFYGFEPLRSGKPIQVEDTETHPGLSEEWRELARQRHYRANINVPLLREGVPIGMISVTRTEPGPFAAHQVELLDTFADQAVIAIENVRLFNETKEALAQSDRPAPTSCA